MEESYLKTISNQVSVRAFIWYYLLSAYINYFIQFFFKFSSPFENLRQLIVIDIQIKKTSS